MTVMGSSNLTNNGVPLHFDEGDLISVIFHVGRPHSGGYTSYFNGTKKNAPQKKVFSIPCRHGRIQIGFFQNVLHSAEYWTGPRY